MAIPSSTISAYAPWGNAQLTFEVGNGTASVDPTTGNAIQGIQTLEYLAALTLEAPSWRPEAGVDNTTYSCRGRLLSPATLDSRITNGTQAEAVINGYRGRLELTFDLTMDREHYRDLRQSIQGTFRVIGGPS